MSKYSFDRMGPFEFESMAQALLEKTYRINGTLIQFGAAQDGGREATWSQPPSHFEYSRPTNQKTDVVKEWVFQVKYHDLGQRGWRAARDSVVSELEEELGKIVHKYEVPCDAYVMITNVPFTGARNVGTRDQVTALADRWREHIPEIYVWDAADLSRLLDANTDVRTAYIDTILPGDVLKAIYNETICSLNRKQSAFKAYLKFVADRESSARSEEAGDEPDLPLSEVFIDLTLRTQDSDDKLLFRKQQSKSGTNTGLLPESLTSVRASFALFFAAHTNILLLGGPGLGKSTLTQFLCLYQAARIVAPDLSQRLAERLKLPKGKTAKDLDACCRPRFPFRIELRRYATWIGNQQNGQNELARYIAEVLINQNASSTLVMDDVFDLASHNPILLALDGLDEVPNLEVRRQIVDNLQVFLRRIGSENGDVQVILSSRPKGYSGEFEGFEPITWELDDLERSDFDEYCDCWLKNRIFDTEERSEAKERINRGMSSEPVQRLAQSLLQATVILTIVRRKIEIPHQRNSLYKKYVEVIFDREKEKTPIVRERENELLRLHERVGYELHCKMEQTRIEALDHSTFRTYVLSVLEDYSAIELGNKTLRDVADEIIEAATDRLCLLVGKGKDQTDVDFVVQQYREYFAAVYLSNHPDADPERAFDVLVRRGAYWAYVLQFYVAQANASQQMCWAIGIPDQQEREDSVEALVRKTRAYRAILNVLPEFALQRKSDFERVLTTIFSPDTRWTWLEQEAAIEILKLIPSIDISQICWKVFETLSLVDNATLAVELWLLAELSTPLSQEFEKLRIQIQSLLDQEGTQEIALSLAFQHDLEVDLATCNISTIEIGFEKYHYKRIREASYQRQNRLRDLMTFQSEEKQCELLLSIGNRWWWRDTSFPLLTQTLEQNLFSEGEVSILGDGVTLRIFPYLCRKPLKSNALKTLSKKINKIQGIHARYLRAILQAIQNPTNNDLDNESRVIESQLSSKIGYYGWRTSHIVGPSPSDFYSIETWKDFKQKVVNFSVNDSKWIAKSVDFDKSQGLWICLFFHPDHWSLLTEENLITESECNSLLNTPLGSILSIPRVPLNIFQGVSFLSNNTYEIPLYKIIQVVLKILEKEGIERISQARSLHGIFICGRIQQVVSIEDLESLLHQANNLPSLPFGWVSAILRLCMNVPGIDIELLLDFWEKNKRLKPHISFIPEEQIPDERSQILKRLLDNNRPSALDLGLVILACAPPNKRIQDTLLARLLAKSSSYLNSDNESCELYFRALLNLDPSLEEFSLWAKPDVIQLMHGSQWMLNGLSSRFGNAVDPKFKLDHEQLRKQFSIFIANRHDYPAIISLGALEAILKIDEVNLSALNSKTWQQNFDE